jgi:iron-sulfur cluster repair protein YtfE (RIC family)
MDKEGGYAPGSGCWCQPVRMLCMLVAVCVLLYHRQHRASWAALIRMAQLVRQHAGDQHPAMTQLARQVTGRNC